MADPLEGIAYGPSKAQLLRRADGTQWIHSFAHGRTVYELKFNARAVRTALGKLAEADVPDAFVRLVLNADLDESEIEDLRNTAHKISGIGKRTLDRQLAQATAHHAAQQANAMREQQLAERLDLRPRLRAPYVDNERLPICTAIDEVLRNQKSAEPPMRDAEGRPTEARCRAPIMLNEMLTADANTGEQDEADPPASAGDAARDAA